jgi:hypothetical protein
MNISVTDSQSVGEVSATLFSLFPAANVPFLITLQNVGINIVGFTFQGSNDGGQTWTNIDQQGGPTNNTLVSGQVTPLLVNASYSQLQVVGFANGGSILNFALSRYFARASGGAIPIIGQ